MIMLRLYRHFPFVKQKDAMQCGIASLSMICQYYGNKYSIDYLSRLCHTTTEGVSMLGITETASKLGLLTMTAYVSPSDLLRNDVTLPAILHWKQNQRSIIQSRLVFSLGYGIIVADLFEFRDTIAFLDCVC